MSFIIYELTHRGVLR